MKKTLPILIAFIFFATNTIFAQYTETINSNRPGDSQSAFSVGSNVTPNHDEFFTSSFL